MTNEIIQTLLAGFPDQCAIKPAQIRESYQYLYDRLLDSYKSNNYIRIYQLLQSSIDSNLLLTLKLKCDKDSEKEQDEFLLNFVNLIYSILTIYPVKYYQTQLACVQFLRLFLKTQKRIKGLKLDWKPFYKVMKYFTFSDESFFIFGEKNPLLNYEKNVNKISSFFELSLNVSLYFPDEIEIEKDGLKIKTTTTEQLVKKFIPRISPNGKYCGNNLTYFCILCPPHKQRYKLFIEYILKELRDTSNEKNSAKILLLILRIIESNIEDDFSFLLPILSQFLSMEFISKSKSKCRNNSIYNILFEALHFPSDSTELLARFVVALFISPPTRKSILDLLKNLFISLKSAIHPSVSDSEISQIDLFKILMTLYLLNDFRKLLNVEERYGTFFEMKKELGPTKDEIHEIILMLSEQQIMNIRKCMAPISILTETLLDPTIIDNYLNIAYQCINFMDTEENISFSGWIILSALVMSIEKNEKIQSIFENIVEIAANNLYRVELQNQIATFLNILASKVPFNKETTIKGLKNVNFPRLASLIFSNLFNIFKTLPTVDGKTVEIEEDVFDLINSFTCSIVQYCDDEVRDEIMNIIISLSTDEDVTESHQCIEIIVFNYCIFANLKQVQLISDVFQKQIELRKNNLNMFRFLSKIYANILPANLKTVESVKQVIDLLLPYTKNEDKKFRKAAWDSIVSVLRTCDSITSVKVKVKNEKMDPETFENIKYEDLDIKWDSLPSLSHLAFEVFDPVYEKLLTMKDPHEINKLIKEIKNPLSLLFQTITTNTEGAINDEIVDEFYNIPIYNVQSNYCKSLPIKDKFVKCALRIIKDFPENENLISNTIEICTNLFVSLDDADIDDSALSLTKFYIPIDYSSSYFNRNYIDNIMCEIHYKRKNQFIIPITDDLKQLVTVIVELSISKYQSINTISGSLVYLLYPYYKPLLKSIITDITNKIKPTQFNEFINLLSMQYIPEIVEQDIDLISKIMIFILNNLDLKDKEELNNLKIFFNIICISGFPFENPKSNQQEFVNLLNEIEKNYLYKNQSNRTYNYILIHIIYMCLKRVYNVSEAIIEFIMKCITSYDEDITCFAEQCLSIILDRREKYTKEKIEIKKYPTIADFPNILNQVSVKFQDDGVYFPLKLKIENNRENSELNFEEEEEEEEYKDKIEPIYSIESGNSIDLDILNYEGNEEISKVFKSFENIEIELKMNNDEFNQLYDSEYLYDESNGFFQFRDHFTHRKYEFTNDKFLLDSMINILSSASNSFNEKNQNKSVRFLGLWKRYAKTVGPYCIKKLSKLCIKFLSEYYLVNSLIVSNVLQEVIGGFISAICYWSPKYRIKFFKLIVLPVVCILVSNPKTFNAAQGFLSRGVFFLNPLVLAPLIKVFFCLSSEKSNLPIYNRSLIEILSEQVHMRKFFYFNTINQLKSKYIDSFLQNMIEYNSYEVGNFTNFLFSILCSYSFSNKESPIYSSKIEDKRKEIIEVFEKLFDIKKIEDSRLKKNLTHAITIALNDFNHASYDLRSLISPLILKHMHTILNILNTSNIKEEEFFIKSVGSFIENSYFYINTDIELKLVSLLIKEMMNLSLPMQLILLENLNKMIEYNIFNIPKDDYVHYEKLLLNYGSFAKSKKLGNELRLKIAKILGIFEIRKSDLQIVNNDDDDVLLAASIILNSFLFDRGDERLTKAFNLMEEKCSRKKSNDKEFFKSVSEIFIYRHTDHVINDVEELIIQYKGLLTPSYIC